MKQRSVLRVVAASREIPFPPRRDRAEAMPRARIVLVVSAIWVLVGAIWGAQNALGSTLRGAEPIPLAGALRAALIQTVPWIPVTLAVIALTVRFPLTREQWRRHAAVHLFAAPVLAFAANVLVVLGFWAMQGRFGGLASLVREGAVWATLRFHIALLIYGAILAITQGALYYRRARARELHLARLEGQLARARLQALNAQIRPHFLFNTLHTIGQLWRSGRSDDADAVLDHLGSLFHRVQRSTSRLEVPLCEELELVREYLAIEEARFRDRLRTSVRATPDALRCTVPPLILQPLVENAVRHGISAVSSAGEVVVDACTADGHLVLTVRDDGPGMAAPSPAPGSGTGLRNTEERLSQLYGPSGRLSVRSGTARGTTVTVEIPIGGAGGVAEESRG
jgi:signal transduction histidine kinase